MDTIDSGVALASLAANAAGVNAIKRNKALTTADKNLFFNMLKPPLNFCFH
jgi:hypothetical protein